MQAFNSWSFKREQPDNIILLNQIIADDVKKNQPIQFIFYWGRGPRSSVASADFQCLDFVCLMANRIKSFYLPGASIRLIFTDTHAELNGYGQQATLEYFGEVATAARERSFEICMLGDLVEAARGLIELDEAEDAISPDILGSLSACASKWYGGGGSAEEGAIRYYQANMVEKRAVEIAFPTSIFITFNGGKFRSLFPATLPIFYMYSLRRGVGVKPWFVNSNLGDHDGQDLPSLLSA